MDQRRPSTRRGPDPVGPLAAVGLAALGLVALATVSLAAAAQQDDPLDTVTTSRLVPELVIVAVVVTVLIGLTLWLVLPTDPGPRPRPDRSSIELWPRLVGLLGWVVLIVLLALLAQRLTTGSDRARDDDLDPDTLAFLSVRGPERDATAAVLSLDHRFGAVEGVAEVFPPEGPGGPPGEIEALVPDEAAAGGSDILTVRFDRRVDNLGAPTTDELASVIDEAEAMAAVEVVLVDADGVAIDLADRLPTDETASLDGQPNTAVIRLTLAVGGVVVVLVVAVGAVLALVRRFDHREDPIPPGVDGDDRPSMSDAGAAPAMREALDRAREGLGRDDDPRLAIIEAYWRLEQAMAERGVRPGPAETSSEFLARCIDALGSGALAARRLTDLFEWAMFSPHAISDSMRDDARRSLSEVIRSLDLARLSPTTP